MTRAISRQLFALAASMLIATGWCPVSRAKSPSTYEVHGVLRSFDSLSREATIAHEEIPGYMPAMTMAFEVRDAAEFAGLQAGDPLVFHLCVTGNEAWIEQVRKTGAQRAASPFSATGHGSSGELSVGDLLPDIALVDQSGGKVCVHDFRGQPLAITFIYTRCPLPTYCPLINRNLETAQTLLERLDTGRPWHFLSISLDPAYDTAEVLSATAEAYNAQARHWSFATAPEDQVRRLGDAVGLEFKTSEGGISHNLRTVVLDAGGRIRRIFRGNSWTPQELAAEMRSVKTAPAAIAGPSDS